MASMRAALVGLGMLALAVGWTPARADLSACIGYVGFDDKANLGGSPAIGVRWGASSRIIGGETSLLVARPERSVEADLGSAVGADLSTKGPSTAIFYEGRFLINIPVGKVRPFVGVGLGAVTVTSADLNVPDRIGQDAETGQAVLKAVDTLSKLQTNTEISYGGGVRMVLAEHLDVRADVRRYTVLSVRGLAAEKLQEQVQQRAGVEVSIPGDKSTVNYDELSLGLSFSF